MDSETAKILSQPSSSSSSSSSSPSQTSCQRLLQILRTNLLVILLILALILGIILGICLRMRDKPYSEREQMYIRYPGELLMNMLKMLILPLLVASMVSGMTSLDARSSGKVGLRAVVYYLTTTLMAVALGIVLVITIQPGKRGSKPKGNKTFRDVKPIDAFLDLIRQMFPDNIVQATFQTTQTTLKPRDQVENKSEMHDVNITSDDELVPVLEESKGINMLGIVVFSIALGIAINHVGKRALPLKKLFDALADTSLVLINVVIWYSPLGVLFLVAVEVASMKDPATTFQQLSFYFLTVMLGLGLHAFVTLPAIFFVICRRNPFAYMRGVLQAIFTALGTASSSATLPVTMQNLEDNNGVDPRVISFVAPVGATINMDGTALYEAVAVIFIGQVEGFQMTFSTILIVSLTATAVAIGGAGIPQAGLVTMVIVLSSVGFPTDRVGLILGIDWLLDRFRTSVNVLGDTYGAGIVEELSKDDLKKMDDEDGEKEADGGRDRGEGGYGSRDQQVLQLPSKSQNNAGFRDE